MTLARRTIVVNVPIAVATIVAVNVTVVVDVTVTTRSHIAVHAVVVNIARRSAKGAEKRSSCLVIRISLF